MESISLASYTIRFRKNDKQINERSEYLPWDDLLFSQYSGQQTFGNPDKISFLNHFCSNISKNKEYNDEKNHKNFHIHDYRKEDNFIYGHIYYGEYGEKRKLFNTTNKDESIIPNTSAVMSLFYFLIYFSDKDKKNGILILERKGNKGFKNIFHKWLKETIFYKYKNYFTIEIVDIIPKKVIMDYVNKGEIINFEFVNNKSHKDSINKLNRKLNEVKGNFSVRFDIDKHYREKAKSFLKKFIKGDIDLDNQSDDFIEILDNKSNLNVTLNRHGKKRKFSFGNRNTLKPYLDVDEDIKNDEGIPEFHKIHSIAVDHARYLIRDDDGFDDDV